MALLKVSNAVCFKLEQYIACICVCRFFSLRLHIVILLVILVHMVCYVRVLFSHYLMLFFKRVWCDRLVFLHHGDHSDADVACCDCPNIAIGRVK